MRDRLRLLCFTLGLALLAVAVFVPAATAAEPAFLARAWQRMVLTSSVPALLMLADPVRWLRVRVPVSRRAALRRRLTETATGRALRWLAGPAVALFLFMPTFWLWHDPAIAAAATRFDWVRAVETVSLLSVGLLYWRHIVGAAPQWHRPLPPIVRILYAFAGVVAIKLVGLVILFGIDTGATRRVLETNLWLGRFGFNDVSLGAILLWVIGGLPFLLACLIFLFRWLQQEADKPPLPAPFLPDRRRWDAPRLRR